MMIELWTWWEDPDGDDGGEDLMWSAESITPEALEALEYHLGGGCECFFSAQGNYAKVGAETYGCRQWEAALVAAKALT